MSKSPTQQETSKPQELSYYYLYNPLTHERIMLEQVNDFYEACNLADAQAGIWEVHAHKQQKAKR